MKPSAASRFGLIGYPLGHSFSKDYFERKFQQANIHATYDNFPLREIEEYRQLVKTPRLVGLNVTSPYKQTVIPFLDTLSAEAEAVNAVNTIIIHNGQSIGHNTDVYGCAQSLLPWLDAQVRQALVLGTGGAARAVSFVLNKMGIENTLVSRSSQKGDLTYDQLDAELCRSCQLIVNATPLGMHPHSEEYPPLPYGSLTPSHYVFDLVYNPEKTLFLVKGEEQGAHIKNGLEMLYLQADRSWEIWKTYLNDAHGGS